jgi:acyl-CoA thioesterase II
VTLGPYPYRARAWWGEVLLAQSASCLCLETDGEPSVLWFPESDIDVSALHEEPPRSDPTGKIRPWTMQGHDVLSVLSEPVDAFDALRGHGTFDPERVRVEVLDGSPDDDERNVTVKRFPTWGDAAHLIEMLDVRPDGPLAWTGAARSDGRRPVVEGSQMLGQAIVAAGRHAPGRRAVSANMIFVRGADAGVPLRFELEELSAGRTFTSLRVQVLQGDRCCASGTLLLNDPSPDVVRHEVEPPDVPGPYECPAYDMAVTGRDLRVVDGAYTDDPGAPIGPPTLDCWVRFRSVPDDPALHAGLLAQFTGHMPIAAALRPHEGVGQAMAHRTLSTGINAITLSVHRDVHADEWMLYHHFSTFAGAGMTHAECRVHGLGGELIASFGVDAMVRPFPAGSGSQDERTAL